MRVGMLWYDDDKTRTLEDKVRRAADYYRTKYGRLPTLCLISPGSLSGGPDSVAKIKLQTAHNVLPHHFWIGMADNGSAAAGGEA